MNVDQFMGHLAARYRGSEEAVRVVRRALERRGWSAGTVLTSRTWRLRTLDARHDANRRNMFNYELRDWVELLCQELSDPSQGEHEFMLASSEGGLQLYQNNPL
jgi:hypothetical protein